MPGTSSSGVRIDYDDAGTGDTALLCLPGWCGSRRVFDPLVERLASKRRVLALDWRGHGASDRPRQDFGARDLVDDALSVIEASGAREVVPVALSHAGWVAIELRRRLGERVAKLVVLDWIVLDPPPPFVGALQALQSPEHWQHVREQLFSMWIDGTTHRAVEEYVRGDMGTYPFEMWARAGREIGTAYGRSRNPLESLREFESPVATLHLYAQPEDPGYLEAQRSFAEANPWFRVERVAARSHFPMFEVPDELAAAIDGFVESP